MSGSGTANGLGADFAELLRELKERSGLSYGVLAKRLHMSTSTLHRYCNGDAVPTDYAPVERLARLCKASPEELVELHRAWVLADAMRRRKGGDSVGVAEGGRSSAGAELGSAAVEPEVPETEVTGTKVTGTEAAEPDVSETVIGDVVSGGGARRGPARRRTRVALVAGVAVAAVLGAVTLAMSLPSGGKEDGAGRTAGAASVSSSGGGREEEDGKGSASPTGASPSVSASEPGGKKRKGDGKGAAASAAETPTSPGGAGAGGADAPLPAPLNVKVEPYTWEEPCAQRYLADRLPAEVGPPPLEQDAPAWVSAEGAVASGQQFVTLTVQGTGEETVVVRGLKVRMTDKRSPLAWNDYAMGYPGVGCGAGVPTRSFTVALDAARPAVQPKAGSRNFPYSVSQSDPEVFYVSADASAYYVSWYLELEWTAGSRSGTLTLNDDGRPFRTSGNNGRPAYEYPLGGPKWVPEGTTLGESEDETAM
ncbi:helix-turn-helix domain-containing protein [Streptomyces sp. SP17KL33]|uniref:helix-turn-helix domain-containing protein n=1 Tax=Streptomyces sp. SP17KL33 TaxID=3002534 RepID=UPI002E78F396|nr:helix-turn-helix domain-containing protein [Streptomyces sp. SP17KL33]MEE1830068.1 helix-turn-helix domain-containing protein [Streptomyces sp. SP17KL33]